MDWENPELGLFPHQAEPLEGRGLLWVLPGSPGHRMELGGIGDGPDWSWEGTGQGLLNRDWKDEDSGVPRQALSDFYP